MNDSDKNRSLNDKIVDFVSDNIVWVFLFFILVVIFLPLLLVKNSIFGFYFTSSHSELGNAIGGMTAPIVGLISAFLIYVAFSAQVKANKELQQFNERDTTIKELNNLFSLIERIEIISDSLELNINQIKENDEELEVSYKGFESIACVIWNFFGKNIGMKNSNIFNHISESRKLYNFLILFLAELKKSKLSNDYKIFFLDQIEKYKIFIDEELINGIETGNNNFYQNIKFENDTNFLLYKIGYKNIKQSLDSFINEFDILKNTLNVV